MLLRDGFAQGETWDGQHQQDARLLRSRGNISWSGDHGIWLRSEALAQLLHHLDLARIIDLDVRPFLFADHHATNSDGLALEERLLGDGGFGPG